MFWTYLGSALLLLVLGIIARNAGRAARHSRENTRRQAADLQGFQDELIRQRELRRKPAHEPLPWNGFRQFVVRRKVAESAGVSSFYLAPHDAKPLPAFKPGQYLTFRLPGSRASAPLIRCYSLSDRPHQPHYRVTIKRVEGPPAGLCSGIFHDQIDEGDLLEVRAPLGHFTLDPAGQEPVVLIGCGIGVTPVFSMLAALVHAKSERTVWFFHGVRHRRDHALRDELAALVRDQPQITVRTCYSQPGPDDQLGVDYDVNGRITVDLLKQMLPSSNFRFYFCGPSALMDDLAQGLKQWGVPEAHLHFESFGAASVKRLNHAAATAATPGAGTVTFKKSGKTAPWDGTHATLLDLAEQLGIAVASGCRTGNCGTCALAVQSGEVSYLQSPGSPPDPGTCLSCIAQPKGTVVLDA